MLSQVERSPLVHDKAYVRTYIIHIRYCLLSFPSLYVLPTNQMHTQCLLPPVSQTPPLFLHVHCQCQLIQHYPCTLSCSKYFRSHKQLVSNYSNGELRGSTPCQIDFGHKKSNDSMLISLQRCSLSSAACQYCRIGLSLFFLPCNLDSILLSPRPLLSAICQPTDKLTAKD